MQTSNKLCIPNQNQVMPWPVPQFQSENHPSSIHQPPTAEKVITQLIMPNKLLTGEGKFVIHKLSVSIFYDCHCVRDQKHGN